MRCEDAAEFVSALYDGERIPREAAEHLGGCAACCQRLDDYAGIAAELRRVASLEEIVKLKAGFWEKQDRPGPKWWHRATESMRIPRLAFILMLAAIFLLSGGLVLVRARPGGQAPVLWLTSKLPPDGKSFGCAISLDGEPGVESCNHFSGIPHAGILSVGLRFLRRDGERVELGVKTRYENPAPDFHGPANERLNGVVEDTVWIEPGARQEISVTGLGSMEITGQFLDHRPPSFFSPEDTVDPRADDFRIVSPVLIRNKQLVFNFAGASTSGALRQGGVAIYWPGEGRYLFSPTPFEGAVEGVVDVSQIHFRLDGNEYFLLTAVPPTRSEHVWVKHEAGYRPSEHMPGESDGEPIMGGESLRDFPTPTYTPGAYRR
jgi:hypothetical protein